MTSVLQIEHHYKIRPNKACTNFTWSFEDWLLLRHRKCFVSPQFVLHKTGGKTCKLKIAPKPLSYGAYNTVVEITFPMGLQYEVMEVSSSLLDENLVKLIAVKDTFRNSRQLCTLTFAAHLFDESLRTYVRNDTLTLLVEITVVKSLEDSALFTDIWDVDFGTDFYKNFKDISDSKDLYDVTFVVEGKQLHAHKVILAANSEVFRVMFTTEMKEQGNDTVEIVDIDATVFEVFLTYMYTGRVTEIGKVVEELIVVADKYRVMNLKKLCECYMSDNSDDDTAITYLPKAYQLSCTKLQKKMH